MAIGTILVTAGTIIGVAKTVSGLVADLLATKRNLAQIRDEIKQFWAESNADSSVFSQRMQELDADVQAMLDCLEEYIALLNRSAANYEQTQQNAHSGASSLKSPTNY